MSICAKAKKTNFFSLSCNFSKDRVFVLRVQKQKGIDMIECLGILSLCPYLKNWLQMNVCYYQDFNGTDRCELNQYSSSDFFNFFERLIFPDQIEEETNTFYCDQMEHRTYFCPPIKQIILI